MKAIESVPGSTGLVHVGRSGGSISPNQLWHSPNSDGVDDDMLAIPGDPAKISRIAFSGHLEIGDDFGRLQANPVAANKGASQVDGCTTDI